VTRKRAPSRRSTGSGSTSQSKTERQNGEGRRGHRGAAKDRHRDAVIHLLVREKDQMRAAAQRRDRATRGYTPLLPLSVNG
jgi:hypothetical protein